MTVVINGTTGIDTVQDGIITNAKIASMAATKLTGQVPDANAPSGSVIQVVQGYSVSQVTVSTTGSYVSVGINASITPISSTSKILALLSVTVDNQATGRNSAFQLRRNGTNISPDGSQNYDGMIYAHNLGQRALQTLSAQFLDSPSTSSSCTYALWTFLDNGEIIVRGDISATVITLMEIAA